MSENSRIEAFEAELKAIDRTFNIRLFVFLAVMLPAVFLCERSSFKSEALDIAFILILVGTISSLVIGIAKAKRRTCDKYGLICPRCRVAPRAFHAISAMRTGVCPRCKEKIGTQPALAE